MSTPAAPGIDVPSAPAGPTRITEFDALRGLAIVCVMYLHAYFGPWATTPHRELLALHLLLLFANSAVPLFLFMSGVLSARDRSAGFPALIEARLTRLAIPLLFWLVAALIFEVWRRGGTLTPDLFRSFLLFDIAGQFYYVVVLLILWMALHSSKIIFAVAANLVIGLSITQLNTVLDSFVAWGFAPTEGAAPFMALPGSPPFPLHSGTATALYLGQRLYQFPLGVFGVALGTVLFPLFARHAQRGESDRLREDLSLGIRLVVAIGLPASAGLMLIAHPLATLFFQYGKFDASAARMTGDMILCYGSGVWAYCGLLILQRAFYAVGDRLTPMSIGLWAMLLNIILNLTLIWPMGGRGLALSTSLMAAIQCLITCVLLQRRIGRLEWRGIATTAAKTVIAVAVMSGVCQLCLAWTEPSERLLVRGLNLVVPLAGGAVAYLASAWLLRLREPWLVLFHRGTGTDTCR